MQSSFLGVRLCVIHMPIAFSEARFDEGRGGRCRREEVEDTALMLGNSDDADIDNWG